MNMKNTLLATALGAGLAMIAAPASAADTQRYLVNLAPGSDAAAVTAVLQSHGVDVVRSFEDANGATLAVNVDMANLPDLVALRAQLPQVTGYGIDVARRTMAIPTPIEDVVVDGETVPWGIQAVDSLGVPYGGGRKVCIIDTGYDLGHPDLQTTRVDGEDEGAGPWDNSDGGGLHYHGTHVAGTIAALGDNGQGVIGVVPGGDLDLHIVRLFDSGGGFVYASDLAGAMEDCAAAGSNVISMSLGGDYSSRLEERVAERLNKKGVLLVAASGNGGSIGGLEPKGDYATFSYPASYDAVMSVAAYDNNLEKAYFSQYTSQVEIAGPGVDVLSTVLNGAYGTASGTSMATPHVSGVAALVWSNHKECSNHQIRNALRESAYDLEAPGYDYYSGWGLVQAQAAMDYLAVNPCKGKKTGAGNH
ncbi:S8 family peptidase [Marilutibacter maris]|uniref:Peptidase S8/S53 subtilisin kexin sedolisin n=1 Tax=Marilutibacter maris TaxID=1605891 RepID=A0A2U9T332_9GAMM|nr:S8 family peptidase [Lysobacter maris]AWV05765.1 peptidase S8/S53 subtilisin kexin sedolisin [Lysobacter maris]